MAEDFAFWDIGLNPPLHVEIDALVVAQIAHAKLKAERSAAFAGFLLGRGDVGEERVEAAVVVGDIAELRELVEAERAESVVRQLERDCAAKFIGWFSEQEEGFEVVHAKLARFRFSAFFFLSARWTSESSEFDLQLWTTAPNRHFRRCFSAFLRVSHSVGNTIPSKTLPNSESADLAERLRGVERAIAAGEKLLSFAAR